MTKLTGKSGWTWGDAQRTAFAAIKSRIAEDASSGSIACLNQGSGAKPYIENIKHQLAEVFHLINGMTDDRFLDHPSFEPILAAAQDLDVPIYLHPHLAPQAVRDLYYGNLPGSAGYLLEAAGWGWHAETALHVLRLVLAGTLDRHPRLKLIIGHMGEGLPAMLARCDQVSEAYV